MAKLAHMMVRVLDEQKSTAFYSKAFGFDVVDRLDFDDFTLVYMSTPTSNFELELTVNKGQDAPYGLGDGYGHLALVVDDLEATRDAVAQAGGAPRDIVDFRPGGTRLARFFFVADPDGYQIEVIEKGGRFT
ncbi:MAG: VOC family protein [Pseudomonadota bacterium]